MSFTSKTIIEIIYLLCFGLTLIHGAVNVDVYFESLCPDSIHFINEQLWPTYKTLDKGIVQYNFYPYGNAHTMNDNGTLTFECQHGPKECLLNIVEACVIYKTSIDLSIEFIHCLELGPSEITAKTCAENLRIDWQELSECYNGLEGKELLKKAGDMTPTHTFIPWIVVDGNSDEEIQNKALSNFLKLVCDTYLKKTGELPSSCEVVEM